MRDSKSSNKIESINKSLNDLLESLNGQVKEKGIRIYDEENKSYYISEFFYNDKEDEIMFRVEDDPQYMRNHERGLDIG